MADFQKGPSQLFFFRLLASQREVSFQSLGRYIGLTPSRSAFTILLNPFRPEFSSYPEFFKSCMKLSRCFCLNVQLNSLLQFNSLLINSWVRVVRFCPQGWAEVDKMTFLAAIGLEKKVNRTCWTVLVGVRLPEG